MAGRIAYYGNIVTQGLVLDLDAAIQGSYPKTGSTWFDISNNGNNGTLTNGPLYTGSDYGAIRFDGVDDYVNTPYTTSIGLGNFSYNTWVNFTSSQLGAIIVKRVGAPSFEQFSLVIAGDQNGNTTGSKFAFNDVQSAGSLQRLGITSGSYNDGRWHNVTLTRTSTTTTMYVEGAPTITVTSSPLNLSTSSKLFIGRSGDNQTVTGIPFNGSLSTAQVYNQSLTQFQVWQNFNAYKSRYGIPDIVTDGLILNLDAGNPYSYLSGSSGTTWSNTVAVSSSISGTLVNGPVYSNGYITCDGTNDYIEVLDNSSLDFGSGSFTVEYWFRKLQTTTGYDNIWGPNKWNTGAQPGTNEWSLAIGNGNTGTGNQYGFIIESGSVVYGIIETSTTQLSLNTWYQLVGQRDGANFKTYLNGVLTMNVTASGFTTSSIINNVSGRNLRINNSAVNAVHTNADNANLKIYNRALTQTEITQNFNALRGRYGI